MYCVKTNKGMVEGVSKEGYTLFAGIPYAKPPVGDLRWKAPVEMEPWEGIREAKTFANRSMQDTTRSKGFYDKEFYDEPEPTVVSEDGLYLNIWTPAEEGKEKLPVAFWIHGGAFRGGFGHEIEFDGEAYCKRDVILVTINYRLDIFGFLCHPELSKENEMGVSGNYGIMDQIAALNWVYENIAAFGGDPENITVYGQSAGCMSVQTLVSSPLTENKIAKVIFQSGLGFNGDRTLEEAEKEGINYQEALGVSSIAEMRALSAEKLLEIAYALREKDPEMCKCGPVLDGYLLKEGFVDLMESGAIKDIPYMAGSTKEDIAAVPENPQEGKLYKGAVRWAKNQLNLKRTPAYLYYFSRQLPGDDLGAFHSAELWYMFGTWKRCWRPFTQEDESLSERMMDAWTNFMKTGNPNGEENGEWKPYLEQEGYIQVLK